MMKRAAGVRGALLTPQARSSPTPLLAHWRGRDMGLPLIAERRVHLRLERQLIKVLNVLQRAKRQFFEVHLRLGQVLNRRWGILDPGPGNAMAFLRIGVFLLPQLVPQPHPVKRTLLPVPISGHAGPLERQYSAS